MTNEQILTEIVESVGYRAWVNQPSTSQQWHRFHGRTGWVIPHKTGVLIFYFMPRNSTDRALAIGVTELEISSDWPNGQ